VVQRLRRRPSVFPSDYDAEGHKRGTANGNEVVLARHRANGDASAIALNEASGDAASALRPANEVDGNATAAGAESVQTAAPLPTSAPLPTRRDAVFRRSLALADVTAALGGLVVLGWATHRSLAPASIASVPLIVVLAKLAGRYDHDEVVLRKSTLDEAPQLMVLAAAFALAWSVVAFFAGVNVRLGGAGVVSLWASVCVLLVLLRASARALAQAAAPAERALVVGPSNARAQLARALGYDPSAHVEVVGFLPLHDERRRRQPAWNGSCRRRRTVVFDDLERVVREQSVERVFLIPTGDSEVTLEAVKRTAKVGVKVSIVPRLFEVVGSAVEFDTVGGVTVLGVRRPGLSRSSRLIKRTIDVLAAALGLLVLAPFGALVALLTKLDTPGPVFFRQPRVGKDGELFQMLKFRSMLDGAHNQRAALAELNETDGLFKLSADPRVTRVGRLLRRTSLDELPQLINVLRGQMSLVGPRPLIADEDVLIEGPHRERLQLTPGMTGPWQVLGPSRPPLSEMVKVDYLYAANWSLWNDAKILLRTLSHVFARRGR
jgi:exopolysaccharide biosynthesis polyprenyl glycosylphosphotransferase